MNNIILNQSIVYVVIEITDPHFSVNHQNIKYDDKELMIVGTYEDRSEAQLECDKKYGRYVLSSNFHKSKRFNFSEKQFIFPENKPFVFPEPTRPFGFPEPTKPFGFPEPKKPFGCSITNEFTPVETKFSLLETPFFQNPSKNTNSQTLQMDIE